VSREIEQTLVENTPIDVDTNLGLRSWVEAQAQATFPSASVYLLAHMDDGVIWGRIDDDGKLITPTSDFVPELRVLTLQALRLFNQTGEVFLWRDGDGQFHARQIVDGAGNAISYFDEAHVLWGDDAQPAATDGFTLMSDGAQGLRHLVPLKVNINGDDRHRPLRLYVRHYLCEDETGFVRVSFSRLIDLRVEIMPEKA
jgi:CRISPR-associated protein (TIGR03984 family)